MKKYVLVVAAILLIPLLSLVKYSSDPLIRIEGFTQGTTFRVIYNPGFDPLYLFSDRWNNYRNKIEDLLQEIDLSLSAYNPESVISRINSNDPEVKVDKMFLDVFKKALEVTLVTGGAFDITVGPLVNAWGFGPGGKIGIDEHVLDSLLKFVGMDKLRLEDNKILKMHPGVRLDVNAIAQGYSVDIIAGLLEEHGVKDYLVEIGGEVRTTGSKPGHQPWVIGIDRPEENNFEPGRDLQEILEVHDIALATSGNYRKFYEVDGTKVVHSINPKTGYPVRHNLLSVTVTAKDCMTADAFATAFMVMGLEKARLLVSEIGDLEAYFVYSDKMGRFRIEYTPGFARFLANDSIR